MIGKGGRDIWTIRHATVKSYSEEEAGLAYMSVVLAGDDGVSQRYVEFQLSLDEDDADEGYCILDQPPVDTGDLVYDITSQVEHRSLYGGVEACEVDRDELKMAFTRDAMVTFGWPRHLHLRLELNDTERRLVLGGLAAVLGAPPKSHATRLIGFEGARS